MRHVLFAAMLAAGLQGAAIRGVVLENLTGRPVARTTVVAQPIPETPGATRSVRSDLNGAFEIPGLAGGAWLVVATRRGFAPTQYGKGPVKLDENATVEVSVRLRRFAAIIGTVLDENDVGLQEHDVVAYRNARPPVLVARAKTDDRGVYRMEGLMPGSYFLRTVGREYDEGSYLHTFSRETTRVEEARPVEVKFDDEIAGVDIRPLPGRLVVLAGRISGPGPTTVYLNSDTGTQMVAADKAGNFRFPPTPPASYELYAQGRDAVAWQALQLFQNTDIRVTLGPFPELRLTVKDAAGEPVEAQILVRRVDLAGVGKPATLRDAGRVLAPGRYEFSLAPSVLHYAMGVRPDGWQQVVVIGPDPVDVKFTLSTKPATLRGVVRNAAREVVAGASVHLAGLRTVVTDLEGRFEFYGLPPGTYRMQASFDAPDEGAFQAIAIEEGQNLSIDLDLRGAR